MGPYPGKCIASIHAKGCCSVSICAVTLVLKTTSAHRRVKKLADKFAHMLVVRNLVQLHALPVKHLAPGESFVFVFKEAPIDSK
jgi:hypothetical protein